jgi:hypothetical protein
MPKFAANLSFLFTDHAFRERFRLAAAAGFQGVEYLFPYDWPAHDVAEWLKAADIEQVLFNLPPGDWAAGERGLACLPDRHSEFAEGVEQALNYAMLLDCERVGRPGRAHRPPSRGRQIEQHLLDVRRLEPLGYIMRRPVIGKEVLDALEPGGRRQPEALAKSVIGKEEAEIGSELWHGRDSLLDDLSV